MNYTPKTTTAGSTGCPTTTTPPALPTIVVYGSSLAVDAVVASAPARVIVCDRDIEDADPDSLVAMTDGSKAWVSDFVLEHASNGDASGIDAHHTAAVAASVDATRLRPTPEARQETRQETRPEGTPATPAARANPAVAQDSAALQQARHRAADAAFETYDFGADLQVEDASGWEYTSGGDEYTRIVYALDEDSDTHNASKRLRFVVRFGDGDEVLSAQASNEQGRPVGGFRKPDLVTLRATIEVRLDAAGVPPQALREQLQRSLERAIGEGALSGHTEATVDEYDLQVALIERPAADLDEDELRDWLASQIESGNTSLESLPRQLARYALTDPGAMRLELAERMGRL